MNGVPEIGLIVLFDDHRVHLMKSWVIKKTESIKEIKKERKVRKLCVARKMNMNILGFAS